MAIVEVNGVSLHVESTGDGPPLLLLHGFTGSARGWLPQLPALAEWYRVIRVDTIGHGLSQAPQDVARYSMGAFVDDLVAVLDHLGVERSHLLGYSMGGRIALHLALAEPQRIGSVVLESASFGVEDPEERRARLASDAALAESISRDGIRAFVDRWERLPLFATQMRLPAAVRLRQRAERLSHTPSGLANSLRGMGAAAQECLFERLSDLENPVLLMAGDLDDKYCRMAHMMHRALPVSTLAIVPDAGHNVHLERPDTFKETVLDFLSTCTI